MTHYQMIEVIAAHRDGKKIQSGKKRALAETDFYDDNDPTWDFRTLNYRIKPELVNAYGVIDEGELFLFHFEEEAKADVARNGGRMIKLIEEV